MDSFLCASRDSLYGAIREGGNETFLRKVEKAHDGHFVYSDHAHIFWLVILVHTILRTFVGGKVHELGILD